MVIKHYTDSIWMCIILSYINDQQRSFFVDILGVDFTINNNNVGGLVGVGGAGGDDVGGGAGVLIFDETKCLKGSYLRDISVGYTV